MLHVMNLRQWHRRYEVNSSSSQFVLKSFRSHFGQLVLIFPSIRTHGIFFGQFVLIWSIRTHFSFLDFLFFFNRVNVYDDTTNLYVSKEMNEKCGLVA